MTFQKLLVDVSAMVEKVNGEKARMASVNESMIKNLGGDLDEILKDERTGERLKPDNIKKVNVHLSTLTMSREDTFNTLVVVTSVRVPSSIVRKEYIILHRHGSRW